MRAVQVKMDEQPGYNSTQNEILVKDLIRYLTGLAKLNADEKTGNLQLAAGLRDLTKSLRPFSNRFITELPDCLAPKEEHSADRRLTSSTKDKVDLPTGLDGISHDAVERIPTDRRYTTSQLAELGFRRYGISKASLARRSKKEAAESIRSTLENERTLDAISEAARKAGQTRTS